jgi:AcrR family transcriptional regulator
VATAATGRAGNESAPDQPGGDPAPAGPTVTQSDTAGTKVPNGAPPRGGRLPRSARRKQLMAAAQEVFVANGYHAAAMDDIADRAGVSKPVLYQHFPGKLELYLALLDMHTNELVGAVRSAMAATTDNAQRVHNAVSAYFDFVDGESAEVQGAFRLVFETDLRNEPAVRERIAGVSRLCMQAVADTIAADTGLPQAQVELLAATVTGTSEVAARWWLESDRALPKAQAVRLIEGLVWRGISVFPLVGDEDR